MGFEAVRDYEDVRLRSPPKWCQIPHFYFVTPEILTKSQIYKFLNLRDTGDSGAPGNL